MGLSRRKLAIGLVALVILMGVYLGYTRLAGTERIDLTVHEQFPNPLPTDSAVRSNGNAASVGGLSVDAIRQTEFRHKNDEGVVDREFGFETLLHQEGDQWEITKPYMRLFMPQFRCHVTADQGQAQFEMGSGTPAPDDAMFSGNVVIHIIPNDPNDPHEAFIYLDDVAFIAERSLFRTAGPIKFVSHVAQLVGRGMELIYDEGRNRLDLFRIQQLGSLRFRSADLGRLSDVTNRSSAPAAPAQPGEPTGADEVIVLADAARAEEAPDYYECVLWENVRIETPEQIIVARRRLAIHNILWSGDSTDGPATAAPGAVSAVAAAGPEPNEPNKPEIVPYPGPKALDTSPSQFVALSTIPESSFDIIVTCDGGFVVGPKGIGTSAGEPGDPNETARALASTPPPADPDATGPGREADPNHQTLSAERIDVDVATSNVVLAGPVQIGFVLADANDTAGEPMPVTISARDVVRYLAATNQIRLEGDCRATMRQTLAAPEAPPAEHEYVLEAPALLLDLIEDPNAKGRLTPRHVATQGGAVSVHGVRRLGDETVGWVKLDGVQLDFDVADNDLVVAGPGAISLHNAQAIAGAADASEVELSLRRPCYALISDFQRLTYAGATQRIVAESDERIQLGYVPILADPNAGVDRPPRYGPPVNADAGHVEIQLTETPGPDGRRHTELAAFTASRGVTYEDQTRQFAGSTLAYDHATGLLHVTGDAAQPCYFNGVLVDEIEMDVTTGDVKMQVQGPGTLQLK